MSFWNTVSKTEFVQGRNWEELWTFSWVLTFNSERFWVPYHCITFYWNGSAVYTHQGQVFGKLVNTNPG